MREKAERLKRNPRVSLLRLSLFSLLSFEREVKIGILAFYRTRGGGGGALKIISLSADSQTREGKPKWWWYCFFSFVRRSGQGRRGKKRKGGRNRRRHASRGEKKAPITLRCASLTPSFATSLPQLCSSRNTLSRAECESKAKQGGEDRKRKDERERYDDRMLSPRFFLSLFILSLLGCVERLVVLLDLAALRPMPRLFS